MKKIFLMTGIMSVLSAPAMAETKWFIGANIGYAGPVLSDDIEDAIDEDFFEDDSGTFIGAFTGGMRFGAFDKFYNGGVSLTWAYMPDLVRVSDGDKSPVYIDGEGDLTTLYITYDNYIKISDNPKSRTDFIASVGLGNAWVKERLTVKGYGGEDFSDSGAMAILKLGFGETIVNGIGWNIMASFIGLNAEDDVDIQGAYSIDFGLKYTF